MVIPARTLKSQLSPEPQTGSYRRMRFSVRITDPLNSDRRRRVSPPVVPKSACRKFHHIDAHRTAIVGGSPRFRDQNLYADFPLLIIS